MFSYYFNIINFLAAVLFCFSHQIFVVCGCIIFHFHNIIMCMGCLCDDKLNYTSHSLTLLQSTLQRDRQNTKRYFKIAPFVIGMEHF